MKRQPSRKRLCVRGHDRAVVGVTSSRRCAECTRLAEQARAKVRRAQRQAHRVENARRLLAPRDRRGDALLDATFGLYKFVCWITHGNTCEGQHAVGYDGTGLTYEPCDELIFFGPDQLQTDAPDEFEFTDEVQPFAVAVIATMLRHWEGCNRPGEVSIEDVCDIFCDFADAYKPSNPLEGVYRPMRELVAAYKEAKGASAAPLLQLVGGKG